MIRGFDCRSSRSTWKWKMYDKRLQAGNGRKGPDSARAESEAKRANIARRMLEISKTTRRMYDTQRMIRRDRI